MVVMYCHPSSTGGPTVWDFAATPGAATEFIAKGSQSGKAARELFKHGMRCLFKNKKKSDPEESPEVITETIPVDTMGSSEGIAETTALPEACRGEPAGIALPESSQDTMVASDNMTTASVTSTLDQCPATSSNVGLIAGEINLCYTERHLLLSIIVILSIS